MAPPPGLSVAELPLKVTLVSPAQLPFRIPPPVGAVLPLKVTFLMVAVPLLNIPPPPASVAELPLTVTSVRLTLAAPLLNPNSQPVRFSGPQLSIALPLQLDEVVLLRNFVFWAFSVPVLAIAPPSSLLLDALLIVRFLSVRDAPEATLNTRMAVLPLI